MKLLVISLAGNGDTLFATPLIHELRANFPTATIDVLVRWRAARDLLEGNPHVNQIYQRDLPAEPKTTALRFLAGLRPGAYDASFNTHPQSHLFYRLTARVIGAHARISHSYHGHPLLDRLFINRLRPQDYTKHAVENNLALLDLFNAKPLLREHGYELYLTAAEQNWATGFIVENNLSGRKLLGIHVGSGGTKNLALRRWPLAHYLALINQLARSRPDMDMLLFGGPDEHSDHERVRAETDTRRVFFPATKNLRQAAALVKHCHAFLSVDTVMMHIAAAMRVPGQIVIETPTWNIPIQPYGNPFTLVKNPAVVERHLEFYRYDGAGIKGTSDEITRCMKSVTVESVFDAVMRAVS